MAQPLRVLIVEDNATDAELMLRELRHAAFEPDWHRVDSEADYLAALHPELDVILSDYSMPQFSGLRALELLKERKLEIPFILVSATIGEETAVAAMRSGAADYLLKDRLTRLGQAVSRALEESRLRKERESAHEAMQQSEHKYRHLFESLSEAAFLIDAKSRRILDTNLCAEKLLARTRTEILGMNETELFPPNEAADCCARLTRAGTGARGEMLGAKVQSKSGTTIPVRISLAPIKLYRRDLVLVLMADVTEQFVAAARLKLQEQQYRLLFETNPSPMWVFDARSLEILAVNQPAIAQYGYSRDEFLKLTIKDLCPPDNVLDLLKSVSSPRSPGHYSGHFRHRKKDSSLILVEIYSGPLIWEGVPARIVTAIDVTERNRAQERLREQADIINRAQDAVIIRDFNTDRITFWNTGAERLYGWSASEAIGRPMGELIFAESTERKPLIEHLLSTGEFHGEIKHCAKDGCEVTVDSRVTLIRNDDGTPRSVLGINTDVTEQKKLETQLLRSQRLESIGTLASGVAHDLNNILTPILMCADVLRQNPGEDDAASSISLIDESARRGAAIVKQVLTFARGVEGERVLIKPSHLIEEMIDIARKTFPKSIELIARYPEDLWTIQGDPTQLHQVLLNLSVNARDAMPPGGSLTIAAENFIVDEHYAAMTPDAKAGPCVVLCVSDTGAGMSRATIDKIFDPFFTTKEIGKGTGLGLSTALGIVKSHGGFISVYSEVGKGTTFKIFLPATMNEEALQRSKTLTTPPQGNGEQILVVDDEPNILQITKMIFEKYNYRVLSANDGPEALAIFAQEMPSIGGVLTDVAMPYMDGVALVRALKKMKSDIPIIASTGQGERSAMAQLQSLGVNNFLTKPYDTEKLLTALRDALDRTI